jgi:hypothetical protein
LGVSSSIRRASYIAVFGVLRFWSVTILRPHVAAYCAEFNSFPCIQLSQPVLELLIFVGNIWLVDLAFRDFGSFPIRSAISVRSIGLGRFDGHTTISSQVCHVGTRGVGRMLHQTKGYRCTSVQYPPCTLAYLTELLPTFTNIRRLLVVTWIIVIFRFLTSAFSVFVRQYPYSRRDLADLTAIRPCQARYVVSGLPVLAGCCTGPRGADVLRSSIPCTLAHFTELWSTFQNSPRFVVETRPVGPYGRSPLADLTAIRPYQARYVMLGPPVLAGCSTRLRGTVVLRSSTPCTLAYLTEVWSTFKNFRHPLVLTLATMLFRLFLVGYIDKVVMSDNTASNFNSTYHRYLSTDFDAVWCLGTSAQSPVRIHREIRYGRY